MSKPNPMEMLNELIHLGYVLPSAIEPSKFMVPTAYVTVPSMNAFHTPPVTVTAAKKKNAKLGVRTKRNSKRAG